MNTLSDVVVQSPSRVQLFVTPWTVAHQASLSLTVSQSLPKFMPIASVMPSSHLILWDTILLLPSIFPSVRDWVTHYPNNLLAERKKKKHVYHITFSVDQEFKQSLAIYFASGFLSQKAVIRCQPESTVISRFSWNRIDFHVDSN